MHLHANDPRSSGRHARVRRIGAIHSVVFGGFSAESLRDRINDSSCKVLITADEGIRGGGRVPPQGERRHGLQRRPEHRACRGGTAARGAEAPWQAGRDHWYHDLVEAESEHCPPEDMDAEDPLFILYTSGSTGKPKGVLHTAGGYLLYAAMTHRYVFDYHDGDIYWCTADVGWITGHSYIVYGPLANGATTVVFEGVPTFPDAGRFWQIVDKHRINIFYTAPTAIRALMQQGRQPGAPLVARQPQAARDGRRTHQSGGLGVVSPGRGRRPCPHRGHLVANRDGRHPDYPASGGDDAEARLGHPALLRSGTLDRGRWWPKASRAPPPAISALPVPGPGQMRTVYGDHQRFFDTYFARFPGLYFTGDGARRDKDGYFWITGRVDDVINVSGHRLGTAEIESALVLHETVAEAAVVGCPHPVKGQGIYAYVTLMKDVAPDEALRGVLVRHVRGEDRGNCHSGRHPVGAWPSQDPFGQESCGGFCAKWPPTSSTTSVTPPPWRSRRSWTTL